MYLYVDKFDYCINNLNNEEIEEETDALEDKLKSIEENNIFFFRHLQKKIKTEEKGFNNSSYTNSSTASTDVNFYSKIDLSSEKVIQNRYDNLTNQIYTLQIKQIAESIWNIKRDIRNNNYLLVFDQNENIESISLDEPHYKELLKFRDPMNSVSVYDLFQEKIYSYYNGSQNTGKAELGSGIPSPMGKELTAPEKKKRGRKPKKKVSFIVDDQSTWVPDSSLPGEPPKKKRGRKKKEEVKQLSSKKKKSEVLQKKGRPPKEEVEIARVVNVNYDFCHHCKQRKPAEVMVRCCSSLCSKFVERPVKTFYVNNTTCVRSKWIIITHIF